MYTYRPFYIINHVTCPVRTPGSRYKIRYPSYCFMPWHKHMILCFHAPLPILVLFPRELRAIVSTQTSTCILLRVLKDTLGWPPFDMMNTCIYALQLVCPPDSTASEHFHYIFTISIRWVQKERRLSGAAERLVPTLVFITARI